jgi:RNase P subunit RPR2
MMLTCWECDTSLLVSGLNRRVTDPATGVRVTLRCLVCQTSYELTIRQTGEPDAKVKAEVEQKRKARLQDHQNERPVATMLQLPKKD